MLQRDVGAVTSYAEAVAGGYTGTRAQWRNLLANLPKAPFFAEYGVTDYETARAAFDDERPLFATNGNIVLSCVGNPNDQLLFSGVISGVVRTWSLDESDVWDHYEVTIPENADDCQYDNTASGLESADVQDAIDEIVDRMNDGLMIVTATATWQAGTGELTSFTITSGQTDGDVCLAALSGTPMLLIVDSETYVLASKTSSPLGSADVYFTLTYAGAVRVFTLSRSRNLPYTYTWTHSKAQIQTTDNLVTSISSSSTDAQYPSAKCVYDLVGNGMSDDVKDALLTLASKVAYIDEHGADYYQNLYDALYPPIPATSITLSANSLSFDALNTTQTLTAEVLPSDTTDTVSWVSSDTTVATVSDGVVTSVGYGSATITATVGNVSAVCSVVVAQGTLVSISAVYTQSGTVYNTDDLSAILTAGDLVVTATWSNSTTSIVPNEDVTLSGSLTLGTSTITVEYGGKSDTISVTVTNSIPAGYTRVQYLHSSASAAGTQSYINTGITFSNPTLAKFHVIFSEDSGATSPGYAIGVRQTGTGNTNNIGWGVRIVDNTKVGSWSGGPGADATVEAASMVDAIATWQSEKVTIQVGSGDVITSSQTVRSITAGYPICLFGLKYATAASGGSPYPIKGKIFYAKAEQDGTVLFECYPVVRDSDSKPGFYDIKNNAFYAPYGNYITAGPEE